MSEQNGVEGSWAQAGNEYGLQEAKLEQTRFWLGVES